MLKTFINADNLRRCKIDCSRRLQRKLHLWLYSSWYVAAIHRALIVKINQSHDRSVVSVRFQYINSHTIIIICKQYCSVLPYINMVCRMRYRLLYSQRPHAMKNLQIMSDANEANQPFEITHNQTRALACRSPISETVKYVVISTAKAIQYALYL